MDLLLESGAVISALLYVFLAAREKPVCFVFGLISSAIYIYICVQTAYYYDAFINAYYVVMSFYGLFLWKRGNQEKAVVINSLSRRQKLYYLAVGVVLTVIFGFIGLTYLNSSLPFIDAFTTVFAFIATWMVVKKNIENWIIWIVVDGVGIGMYWYKDLKLTALLFLIYTIIAFFGYTEWKKKLKTAH